MVAWEPTLDPQRVAAGATARAAEKDPRGAELVEDLTAIHAAYQTMFAVVEKAYQHSGYASSSR